MSTSHTRRLLLGAAALAALGVAAPAASASSFDCSASAVRGSVLGQPAVEPVTANVGGDACRSITSSLDQLPAPLSGAALAVTDLQSGDDPSQQAATAVGTVSNLRVGGLRSMPLTLPQAQLPSGLDAVEVPLSQELQLLGLPSSITVDALAGAQKLVPAQQLPDVDVVAADAIRSLAGARCVDGRAALAGVSDVAGLKTLGQSLPTDQAVQRAVTLIDAVTVPLSGIDLADVQLPAGLSFDDPLTGELLRQAVRSAIDALPPIQVPATVADVHSTPAQQSRTDGGLVQEALKVRVDMLGQTVADLVLGIARIGDRGVSCTRAAAAPEPVAQAPAEIAPASQLAVSCSKRKVTLIDVVERRRHVALVGAADKSLVGKKVSIVFTHTGRRVATAVVRPDGYFRAKAKLPSRRIRHTNKARYQARIGRERSLKLKLHRRMRISKLAHRGERVVMAGKVYGPRSNAKIEIRRRVSCTKDVVVRRITPRRDGTFRVTLPAPPDAQAAVYRATTQVQGSETNPKRFPTFTLPGYVSL